MAWSLGLFTWAGLSPIIPALHHLARRPNRSLKLRPNGRPPSPRCSNLALSASRAWRPTVGPSLALTLCLTIQVVSRPALLTHLNLERIYFDHSNWFSSPPRCGRGWVCERKRRYCDRSRNLYGYRASRPWTEQDSGCASSRDRRSYNTLRETRQTSCSRECNK